MYIYVCASTLALLAFMYKMMKTLFFKASIKKIVGLDMTTNKTYDKEDDAFEVLCDVYFIHYEYKGRKYCKLSKVPIEDVEIDDNDQKHWILSASVSFDEEKQYNVTDIITYYAGPNGNFHKNEIDFRWIFKPNGTLNIIFDYGSCIIDLETNTKIYGTCSFELNHEEIYDSEEISDSDEFDIMPNTPRTSEGQQ